MTNAISRIPATDPEVLNLEQAAAMLNFSKSYLYKLTSGRGLPFYKKGKKVYFLRSELIEWIKTGRVKTNIEIEQEAINYVVTGKRRKS